MKTDVKKIKRTAHILRILIAIALWVVSIVGIIITASTLVFVFKPDIFAKLVASGNLGVTLGFNSVISFNLGSEVVDASRLTPVLYVLIPTVAMLTAAVVILLRQISDILKTVEMDSPFEEANSKRLSIIGVVMLIGSVLINAAQCVMAIAMVNAYNINSVKITYSIDINMMITGFLILILAGVFKYGSFLQKEYDSTL